MKQNKLLAHTKTFVIVIQERAKPTTNNLLPLAEAVRAGKIIESVLRGSAAAGRCSNAAENALQGFSFRWVIRNGLRQ